MRNTTESKKEKIVNFIKKHKETLEEFFNVIFFGFIAIVFYILNLDMPRGIQTMLCIILFYTLLGQCYSTRAYYIAKELKEQKEQEKK